MDFFIILMTNNLKQQAHFYQNVLGLDLQFEHQDSIGLGKNHQLYILLKSDISKNSHHLSEHKGPQIITFKCQGIMQDYLNKIKQTGFRIRDTLELSDINQYYFFIEDFDHNEICLNFDSNIHEA